ALTEAAITLIAAQMEAARLSNGGYALFVRYEEGTNDFLLIAMLKLKAGAAIDEDLELLPTLNIDLGLLNEAARINISRWATRTEPYLTFIKGSRSKSEITEYFRTALACTNFTKSAAQTSQLIDAADAFVAQRQDLTNGQQRQQERTRMRARLHDCLRQNSDEIALATVAASISQENPQDFIDFIQIEVEGERRFNFNDQFRPDKATVRTLKRIEGVMGSVRVSFDVDD